LKKYSTIVIDPPWKYGKWGKSSLNHRPNDIIRPMPYKTMTLEEIQSLPIKKMADINCELYIWTTQKYLYDAICIIKNWGFKYCTTITWCKKPMGKGQGGVYCPTTEFIIHGRIGKMPKVERIDSTWFLTKREHNSHSKKPEFFQDLIETVTIPNRIEMFARRSRPGWDVFGNEVDNSISLDAYKINN
jgi:N6-adenosine-specific RNA methylase IME4